MINGILSLMVLLLFVGCAAHGQENTASGSSTLIVYFSKTGNTQAVAEHIQTQVGGDIFQVRTVKAYPEAYRATTEVARVELDNNERPELAGYIENMDSYDTIFVGFPNWWGTLPMAMYTFLEHYDLAGKTIVPFLTHGGGGVQRCEDDIKKICPDSTILPALVISGSGARNAQNEVSAWLRRLNLAK